MRAFSAWIFTAFIAAVIGLAFAAGPDAVRAAPQTKSTPTPLPTRTPATPAPLGALKPEHDGQVFSVQGRVVDVISPSATLRVVLDDWTAKRELFLTASIYSRLSKRAELNYGAEIVATVRVVYDGVVLRLRPQGASDVTIVRPGTSDHVAVRPTYVLGTQPNGVGALVAIEGEVVQMETLPDRVILIVGDPHGSVKVWIPNRAWQYVPGASRFAVGTRLRVVGRVNYTPSEGVFLVPALGYDVKIR
jgi:hypothetical protein